MAVIRTNMIPLKINGDGARATPSSTPITAIIYAESAAKAWPEATAFLKRHLR